MQRLSEHDRAVLNSIFNPMLPLGEATFSEETELVDDYIEDGETLTPEVAELQKRAIIETEANKCTEALNLFEEALKKCPKSAKILNDRAQCLRLAGRNGEAMLDLNLAIEVSNGQGKAGVRALCQRGILLKIEGKFDDARSDFSKAAKGGSKFAKSQLVELNPYAAMCNKMLKEMTRLN